MFFILLISLLVFSFTPYSAFSFELPASMLTLNHDTGVTPESARKETGPLHTRILKQYQNGKERITVGAAPRTMVTVSDLGDDYWQSHFITARRVTENV